jgi:hypothetical protein
VARYREAYQAAYVPRRRRAIRQGVAVGSAVFALLAVAAVSVY